MHGCWEQSMALIIVQEYSLIYFLNLDFKIASNPVSVKRRELGLFLYKSRVWFILKIFHVVILLNNAVFLNKSWNALFYFSSSVRCKQAQPPPIFAGTEKLKLLELKREQAGNNNNNNNNIVKVTLKLVGFSEMVTLRLSELTALPF